MLSKQQRASQARRITNFIMVQQPETWQVSKKELQDAITKLNQLHCNYLSNEFDAQQFSLKYSKQVSIARYFVQKSNCTSIKHCLLGCFSQYIYQYITQDQYIKHFRQFISLNIQPGKITNQQLLLSFQLFFAQISNQTQKGNDKSRVQNLSKKIFYFIEKLKQSKMQFDDLYFISQFINAQQNHQLYFYFKKYFQLFKLDLDVFKLRGDKILLIIEQIFKGTFPPNLFLHRILFQTLDLNPHIHVNKNAIQDTIFKQFNLGKEDLERIYRQKK